MNPLDDLKVQIAEKAQEIIKAYQKLSEEFPIQMRALKAGSDVNFQRDSA